MLKDMPPYMKPFMPLFAAMGVVLFVDFFLLLAGEWQDANYWSFGIRIGGLGITIFMGLWFRRAWKKFKTGLEQTHPAAIGMDPSSEEFAAIVAKLPPRCTGTTSKGEPCPDYAVSPTIDICLYCWAHRTESRLAAHAITHPG